MRRVQFRILKYLGLLGNRVNHYLIDDTSNYLMKEAVAWDNENHLTFNLPFDDIKPVIHLGKRERLHFISFYHSSYHFSI